MNTNTEIRDVVIELDAAGLDAWQRRLVIEQMGGSYKSVGEAAFWTLTDDRDNESLHDLPGWPECACVGGCSEPATCTDDAGVEVCAACSDCTVDGDGDVHCRSAWSSWTGNGSVQRRSSRCPAPTPATSEPSRL